MRIRMHSAASLSTSPAPRTASSFFISTLAFLGLVVIPGCPPPTLPQPLAVDAGPDINTGAGIAVELAAGVTGGDGSYFFEWTPQEGLDDPATLRPRATPQQTTVYTLTVTDGQGASASDQVIVTVRQLADEFDLWSNGVLLRGANVYQRHVFQEIDGPDFLGPGPLGPPYTQDDFDALAALGANCVNLSHTGLYTVNAPYVVDAEAQASLDRLIAIAAEADLFVVLTFRSGPGRGEFNLFGRDWVPAEYINDAVWTDAAARDAWAQMWRYTANRYKDNPVVIGYDLMCEPDVTAVLNVWDPDEFTRLYAGTTYDWNALFPTLIDAIRQVDTETPILVGAENYSNVGWLQRVVPDDDPRTLYAVHFYAPMTYTHQVTVHGILPDRWPSRHLAAHFFCSNALVSSDQTR